MTLAHTGTLFFKKFVEYLLSLCDIIRSRKLLSSDLQRSPVSAPRWLPWMQCTPHLLKCRPSSQTRRHPKVEMSRNHQRRQFEISNSLAVSFHISVNKQDKRNQLGESGAHSGTGLLRVVFEPHPTDPKRGYVSREGVSIGCHSKHGDHWKNRYSWCNDRVERRESCRTARSLGHRTQPWLSCASDSSEHSCSRDTAFHIPPMKCF